MSVYLPKKLVVSIFLLPVTFLSFAAQQQREAFKDVFFKAVSNNDVALVEEILSTKVGKLMLNDLFPTKSGLWASPLHLAASNGFEDIARRLLEEGSVVDILDQTHRTPLHRAAAEGQDGIVRLLLAHGANVNAKGLLLSETPLHDAAGNNYLSTTALLIEGSALVDPANRNGQTPLHRLVERFIELNELHKALSEERMSLSFLGLSLNDKEEAIYRKIQEDVELAKRLANVLVGKGAHVSGNIIRLLNKAGQQAIAKELLLEELQLVQQKYFYSLRSSCL